MLVVDDDPQVRTALAFLLRHAGYRVVVVDSGEAALTCVAEFSFDVAVCDRQLPGIDGIDVLSRLREIQPTCQRVLMTGALDLTTTLDAVNRGAVTSVLEKPIRGEALVEVVGQAVQARGRMVEAYRTLQQQSVSHEREILRELLGGDDLQLAVQPIVRANGGALFGHEALLRSVHPDLDTPIKVLQAVERHQMIGDLADVVVDRARLFLDRSPAEIKLFLNLHPAELADPEALGERMQRLVPHARRVILEITERSSIYGVAAWERSLEVIRGLGFEVAVDDLGAGYSSLAILAELNPRFIKLDMSIIRDADRLSHKQRLIDLLCRFADATDALLVAEGIESEGEAAIVRQCGAHLLQGFLIGRPRIPATLTVVSQVRGRDVG